MKAAVCHAFGAPLTLEEVVLRPPGHGEVRVAIEAVAICHSDIGYLDGLWASRLPAVYGHEAAGRVVELGAGVQGIAPGDAVVVSMIRACGANGMDGQTVMMRPFESKAREPHSDDG